MKSRRDSESDLFEWRIETTRVGRFTDLDPQKLRGGYYTSKQLASWLASWAIRTPSDTVLEPSCGDGVFLEACAERLINLGIEPSKIAHSVLGIEVIEDEANNARARLRTLIGSSSDEGVRTGDFFEWWRLRNRPQFHSVVGNPPFIRYQTFPEPHRSRAMSIMAQLGLKPNRLTNIWVAFVAAAVATLSTGGRLAFVLPAELLQVSYAAQLRSFLANRFARIDIVTCNELFFENAEQEVVLLLADGARAGGTDKNRCKVVMTETQTVAELIEQPPRILLSKAREKTIRHNDEKWLKYFLTECEIALMRDLRSSEVATNLSDHASIDVGVVTGKNEFFVLDRKQIDSLDLKPYTVRLVSRSIQLRGSVISENDWKKLSDEGGRVYLLRVSAPNGSKLAEPLDRYIEFGESKEFHKGYKCSIRSPWFVVPSVWIPDGFVFRQIHDFPRIVLNKSRATSTDTIHRLTCKGDTERFISNTYTALTAASAEIEGRSYGGGVLELEPTEAERLLVPRDLVSALPLEECDRLIRAGRLNDVLDENSRLVLIKGMGLSNSECERLKGIWTRMRDRRGARRRRTKRISEES